MGTLPDFNKERIELLFGSDADLIQQVLEILNEDIPLHLRELSQAIQREDGRRVYEIAHTLKGSLANVGGEQGSRLSRQMLQAAEEKQFSRCLELYRQLDASANQLLLQLARFAEAP